MLNGFFLEVAPRFELGNQSFADSCLTTWLCHQRLAGVEGFEPPDGGIRIHCLTAWRYPYACYKILGWVERFELSHTGATTQGLNRLTTPTIKIYVAAICG